MTIASDVNQCLSTIKGIESQLSSFALNSQDKKARKVFHETMLMMGDIKQDLQARVYKLEAEEQQYKKP
jgi:hypothetical protein